MSYFFFDNLSTSSMMPIAITVVRREIERTDQLTDSLVPSYQGFSYNRTLVGPRVFDKH
jgi:hypothetical protein